jgi:hypothetical protein
VLQASQYGASAKLPHDKPEGYLQNTGPSAMSTITDVSKTLGDYMLKGWVGAETILQGLGLIFLRRC